MITDRKVFYVDSSKRLNGNNSDFTYLIDMQGVSYQYAVILQANIPKSYYLVENGYNIFHLQEGELLIPITLPPGNYTRSSLKSTLTNLLNNNSSLGFSYKVDIPKSSEPETSIISITINSRSSSKTLTKGVLKRAVTFQSIVLTSSPK